VFVTSGGTPSATRAAIVGHGLSYPLGSTCAKMPSSASDGSARPTFEVLIARNPPRPRCPSHSDSGTAISTAISIDMPLR
jgi:hypothetical protein